MAQAQSITYETCRVFGRKPEKEYEGYVKKCFRSDFEYVSFQGIPYANIPEGMKRYQAPESLTSFEPWQTEDDSSTPSTSSSTVYKANVTGKMCTQPAAPPTFLGSSDCLYLNVFFPRRVPDRTERYLPVLVFIHGGGFDLGSNDSNRFSPEFIVQYGLVLVTINYRLGVYGFLNMRTEDIPGNSGLKDQVKALEWIRDNIACFGGDPNNVTISGHSAGATCVNLHLVAPASKDLFHKAIVQSGGIFCTWGYRGHRFAQKKTIADDADCLELLRDEAETTELHARAYGLLHTDRGVRRKQSLAPIFGPSVEKFPEGAFIPEEIEEMMKKVQHDKPVMVGIMKNEALEQFIINHQKFNCLEWMNNYGRFIKLLMDNLRWSEETAKKHAEAIRNKYFPRKSRMSADDRKRGRITAVKDMNLSRITKFVSDIFFNRLFDGFKFGPEKTLHKNLYVYRFDHLSQISLVNRHGFKCADATHSDDVIYMYCPTSVKKFYHPIMYEGEHQNKEILEVINHMCSLWANFCKTGVPKSDFAPEVEWRRHTEENPCYLSISNNLVLNEESLHMREWDWLNRIVRSEPTVQSQKVTPEDE